MQPNPRTDTSNIPDSTYERIRPPKAGVLGCASLPEHSPVGSARSAVSSTRTPERLFSKGIHAADALHIPLIRPSGERCSDAHWV